MGSEDLKAVGRHVLPNNKQKNKQRQREKGNVVVSVKLLQMQRR